MLVVSSFPLLCITTVSTTKCNLQHSEIPLTLEMEQNI